MSLMPRKPVPTLELKTLEGSTFELSKQRPEAFTGACTVPYVAATLPSLTERMDEFRKSGLVVSVARESQEPRRVQLKVRVKFASRVRAVGAVYDRALEFRHFGGPCYKGIRSYVSNWHFVGSRVTHTKWEYRQEGHSPPCTKARRGGRATKKKVAKPPLIARTGWFSDRDQRKTTPSASASVASRHFLEDADTPPCIGARRGMSRFAILSIFTPFSGYSYFAITPDFSSLAISSSPNPRFCNTSWLCSPNFGGALWTAPGVSDSLIGIPSSFSDP